MIQNILTNVQGNEINTQAKLYKLVSSSFIII